MRKEIVVDGKPAPPEQIRAMAIYYSAGEKKAFDDFVTFFSDMAQKVSKKPLYVDVVMASEWSSGLDAKTALDKAKAAGAVAVLCLFNPSDLEAAGGDLEQAASKQDYFLRVVPLADAMKRSAAVDLVVDLMLVGAK